MLGFALDAGSSSARTAGSTDFAVAHAHRYPQITMGSSVKRFGAQDGRPLISPRYLTNMIHDLTNLI
jgi:hypothetical protein